MKKFIIIAFIFTFLISSLYSKSLIINECMNDIYFANGINTTRQDAQRQLKHLLKEEVKKNIFNGNSSKMKKTVNFKLAYNNTLGVAFDLLEAYQQKKSEHGTFWWVLGTFFEVYGKIAKVGVKKVTNEIIEDIIKEQLKKTAKKFLVDPIIKEAGLNDFVKLVKDLKSNVEPKNIWATINDSVSALENYDKSKQLNSYKKSIKQGHSVIVVAHSQGNFFTNEVYKDISSNIQDKWMIKYFHMIGVASPAGKGTGPKNVEVVTFDNDPITNIPDAIGDTIENPVRYIVWVYNIDSKENSTRPFECIDRKYLKGTVPKSCLLPSDREYNFWFPYDSNNLDFHLFKYYMKTKISRDKIMQFIKKSLEQHKNSESQWKIYKEINKNSCDYRVKLVHKYDKNIKLEDKVYPFNKKQKVYSIGDKVVKASCGGSKILEQWDNKKDDDCFMVNNTQQEKITSIPIGIFYVHYIQWKDSYRYYELDASSYTNSKYKALNQCDGYGEHIDYITVNEILNYSSEENIFYFPIGHALKCIMIDFNKTIYDIKSIEKGSVKHIIVGGYGNSKYTEHFYVKYIVKFK